MESISHKTGDLLQNILSYVNLLQYQIAHEETPELSMLDEIKQSVQELKTIIDAHDIEENTQ